MKKINFTGKLELTGPLSRNEKIKNLKTGEIISGKIIKRINRFEAVIEIFGNKLKGNFLSEVPQNNNVNFKILNSDKGNIIFQIIENEKQDPIKAFLNIFNGVEINKNEIVYNLLNYQKNNQLSIFDAIFQQFKKKKEMQKKMKILEIINKNNTDKTIMEKFILQTLFNKNTEKEFELLFFLLFKDAGVDEKIDLEIIKENELQKFYEKQVCNAPVYYRIYSENSDLKELEYFRDKSLLLVKLRYSKVGNIEIFAVWEKETAVNIFYDNENIRIKDLNDILRNKVSADMNIYYFKRDDLSYNLNAVKNNVSLHDYFG